MADLAELLPDFDLQPWRHLMFSLQKKNVSTTELITLDPIEIARRCPLPLKEVKRIAAAVIAALNEAQVTKHGKYLIPGRTSFEKAGTPPTAGDMPPLSFVRTLDAAIDQHLGGGFPVGKICEVSGQSAAGKTQLVLSLLLSAQLPVPQGLGKNVLYISTEGQLNTKRLVQMLETNPEYQLLPDHDRPTLDRVLAVAVSNMDAQDRLVHYQLNQFVAKRNIGLVVIDSITANYRVAFQGSSPRVLSSRAKSLRETANALRKIAHEHRVAILITNQVSDRFDDEKAIRDKIRMSQSQLSGSTTNMDRKISAPSKSPLGANETQVQAIPMIASSGPPSSSAARRETSEQITLDYQQRFFTGWGHDPDISPFVSLKTPALGLTWANQLDGRIVLKIQEQHTSLPSKDGHIWSDTVRQRFLHVAFASWTNPSNDDIEYTLQMQGLSSQSSRNETISTTQEDTYESANTLNAVSSNISNEHAELLDPKYWEDLDDEFC